MAQSFLLSDDQVLKIILAIILMNPRTDWFALDGLERAVRGSMKIPVYVSLKKWSSFTSLLLFLDLWIDRIVFVSAWIFVNHVSSFDGDTEKIVGTNFVILLSTSKNKIFLNWIPSFGFIFANFLKPIFGISIGNIPFSGRGIHLVCGVKWHLSPPSITYENWEWFLYDSI